jgi:hypothetical protein
LCKLLAKEVDFVFDQACKDAYDELKRRVTSAPIIQPPNWDEPFEIMCDASDYVVRAVLGQRIGKNLHVIIAYASRMLDGAQCTIKLEMNFLQWCLLLKNSSHIYLVQKSLFLLTMQL